MCWPRTSYAVMYCSKRRRSYLLHRSLQPGGIITFLEVTTDSHIGLFRVSIHQAKLSNVTMNNVFMFFIHHLLHSFLYSSFSMLLYHNPSFISRSLSNFIFFIKFRNTSFSLFFFGPQTLYTFITYLHTHCIFQII